MKTSDNLENILRSAPQPTLPADLFETLERQIKLPARPTPAWLELWKRIWVPVSALAGAAAVIAMIVAFGSVGTSNMLAASLESLARVKSFHLVERQRFGPSKPVIIDPNQRENTWPNYFTDEHPDNPMVTTEHWFQLNPDLTVARSRSSSTEKGVDIWREANRMLTVDRQSGERKVWLNNSRLTVAGVVPALLTSHAQLREIPADRMGIVSAQASAFWAGETTLQYPNEKLVFRGCFDRVSRLPVRLQLLSMSFPKIAPEVLLREWEFSDYNTDFPQNTFAFDITAEDLKPLGITPTELEDLGPNGMCFQITGETGAEVIATLTDDGGSRTVRGTIPFTFVHSQQGTVSLDFRMADGKRRMFGARFNLMDMRTEASRLVGTVSEEKNVMGAAD